MKTGIRNKLLHYWRTEGRSLLILLLVLFAFRSAVADWNDVPTGSMKPTILEGDRVFVNKLAYDLKVPFTTVRLANWAEPQRGDIVVCYFMMGDNRDNSKDSRYFGVVRRENILGRATAVVLSVDRNDWYLPRRERFFRRLE